MPPKKRSKGKKTGNGDAASSQAELVDVLVRRLDRGSLERILMSKYYIVSHYLRVCAYAYVCIRITHTFYIIIVSFVLPCSIHRCRAFAFLDTKIFFSTTEIHRADK